MEVYNARYGVQNKDGKNKIKAIVFAVIGGILLLTGGGYSAIAATKDFGINQPELYEINSYQPVNVPISWPEVGQAAFGTKELGMIDATDNQKPQPIASITKVITALTILQKTPMNLGDSGQAYTMTSEDEAIYHSYLSRQGSVMPIQIGEVYSQYDLLNALMIVSANNVADGLVVKTFGTMDAYLIAANELVKSYGLTQTIIADASGFSPSSVSTPSELLVIASRAMESPVLAEIMSKKTYNFPGYGEIKNSNQLLATRESVVGLKTGTTDEAGYCLLFAEKYSSQGEDTVITGVVMGSRSMSELYKNANNILDSAEKGFGSITIVSAGTEVGEVSSSWGQSAKLVTSSDLNIYGWKGSEYSALVKINTLPLVIGINEGVGSVTINNYDSMVSVVSDNSINQPTYVWRLKNIL